MNIYIYIHLYIHIHIYIYAYNYKGMSWIIHLCDMTGSYA